MYWKDESTHQVTGKTEDPGLEVMEAREVVGSQTEGAGAKLLQGMRTEECSWHKNATY